jgi:hypothetical protein
VIATDPASPLPGPHEDEEDAASRYQALVKRSVKRAVKRLSTVAEEHGGGSVALARTGSRGVRIVFVAGDGTFGDAMVPSIEAAEEVCQTGGWEITGWDVATVQRIAPSRADRIRMQGTGR